MGSFDVLNDYKKKLKKMFLQNQDLLKLIFYNDSNPISQKDILNPNILFDGYDLIVDGKTVRKPPCIIFGTKNFKTITDAQTFVLIDFLSSPVYKSTAFKEWHIIITIACHNTVTNLPNSIDRDFIIANKIDDYLNGYKHLGFSKVKDSGLLKREAINDSFQGLRLMYNVNGRSMNYRNNNR